MNDSKQCKCGRPLLPEETSCPNCLNRGAKKVADGGLKTIIGGVLTAVGYVAWNKRDTIKKHGVQAFTQVRDTGVPMAKAIIKSLFWKK